MQLEMLNTLKWLVGWLVVSGLFVWLRKKVKVEFLSFRGLGCLFLLTTLITYPQFFTLTEKSDINNATKQFTYSNQSSKLLNNYLEESKDDRKVLTKEEVQIFVEEQKLKSEELAESILLDSKKESIE